MNAKQNEAAEVGDNHSRFSYHNEVDAVEGGVRVATEKPKAGKTERKPGRNTNRNTNGIHHVVNTGANGLPGPEDRLLDISEIARSIGMYYKHQFSISYHKGDELETAEPITGEVTLTNAGEALVMRGQAKTQLKMECGRCLSETIQLVETDIEEEFDLVAAHSAWGTDAEVEAVDDDETGSVIQGNVLDLYDLLRQNLLLAAPFQPLCREDCRGLDLTAKGIEFRPATEETPIAGEYREEAPAVDNPLRHLAEMLEAKRQQEGE